MSNQPLPPRQPIALLPIITATLVSFGLTMIVMSGAYVQDLTLLREVPEAIWLFVCGVPTDNEMVLPMMMGLGMLTLLVGVALVVAQVMRHRRGTPGSGA